MSEPIGAIHHTGGTVGAESVWAKATVAKFRTGRDIRNVFQFSHRRLQAISRIKNLSFFYFFNDWVSARFCRICPQ
jgi:hypothetical protein